MFDSEVLRDHVSSQVNIGNERKKYSESKTIPGGGLFDTLQTVRQLFRKEKLDWHLAVKSSKQWSRLEVSRFWFSMRILMANTL